MRNLHVSFLFLLSACGNSLDVGGTGGDRPPASSSTSPALPGAAKTPVDCSGVDPAPKVIFRSAGSEGFNVSGLASDGTHVYIAGYGSAISSTNAPKTPDAAHPMSTATLLRVPVDGGDREILDYQHPDFTRGVAVDAANVYWATDAEAGVFRRAKAGGAIVALDSNGANSPQTMTTDGKGNVFWATFYGGSSSPSNPIPAIVERTPGATAPTVFQASRGEADQALWVTSDGDRVYWTAGGGPYDLRSAPTAGGGYTVLATGITNAYAPASDDLYVWGVGNDSVWKVPKSGGARVDVIKANPGRYLFSLAVTDDAIYFGDDQTPTSTGGPVQKAPLYKANKDGSNVHGLTADMDSVMNITTDACHVYFYSFDWVGNPGYEPVVYALPR